jgi:hypothetical protein
VTKHNPADRDRGHYIGREDTDSDDGPDEAVYLDTVAAFAEDTGVDVLQIREPSVPIVTGIGSDIHERFGGLVELFDADLDGYHDGARLQLDHAVELVRLMLRGDGVWCRLEAGDDFFVHVGWDQYVYVGSSAGSHRSVAFAHKHGLFAEPISGSPYVFGLDDDDHIEVRSADAAFCADPAGLVDELGTALLEGCGLRRTSSKLTATIAAPRLHDRAPRQPHGERGARLMPYPPRTPKVVLVASVTKVSGVIHAAPDTAGH